MRHAISAADTGLETTGPALAAVRAAGWAGPLGALSGYGDWLRTGWGFKPLDPAELQRLADGWAEESRIQICGGCCGIGPNEVAGLAGWKQQAHTY